LRIVFEEIEEGNSARELDFRPEDIALESELVKFIGPVKAMMTMFKQDDNVYIKAELSVLIEAECARCLKPVRETLKGTLENQYQPESTREDFDDIGIAYYSGEYVELSDDFRESLLLELPTRILCSEDCKGLCHQCGQNLNEGKCSCLPETEPVRASKFAELFESLEIKKKLEV